MAGGVAEASPWMREGAQDCEVLRYDEALGRIQRVWVSCVFFSSEV